jgi:hypothetical protein
MNKYTFYGIAFKQNPSSPQLFAFVASADALRDICGVARKEEHNLTAYQRALDLRRVREEVAPFFAKPENCSPTAVVLSLQKTPVCNIEFSPIATEVIPSEMPFEMRQLTISFEPTEKLAKEVVCENMKAFLNARLGSETPESETEQTEEILPEDVTEEETQAEEVAEEEEEEIEIATSMLRKLRERLETPDTLEPELIEAFREMLKPGLVIDGQHRLFGAAEVEENIPLLVCAMVEPEWREQVFQFTVINDKAVGISRAFISSLAGMSLTATELGQLQNRLLQAGIQLWEVEVMQRLGHDPRSPLYQMIDFRINPKAGSGSVGLGYQTIKKLGRAWYEASGPGAVLLKIVNKIERQKGTPKLTKKALRTLLQSKETNYWFDLYRMFWIKVRDRFEPDGLWKIGSSNLMIAVVLVQLQNVFFSQLAANFDLTIGEIEEDDKERRREAVFAEYNKVAVNFIKKFNSRHFTRSFVGSLNFSEGQKHLKDYFAKIYSGDSLANHPVLKASNE